MSISTNAKHIQKVYKGDTLDYDDTYGEWQDTDCPGVQMMATSGIICFKGIISYGVNLDHGVSTAGITIPSQYKNLVRLSSGSLITFTSSQEYGVDAQTGPGKLVLSNNRLSISLYGSTHKISASQILLSYTN